MSAKHIYKLQCDGDNCKATFQSDDERADITRQKASIIGWSHTPVQRVLGGPYRSIDECDRCTARRIIAADPNSHLTCTEGWHHLDAADREYVRENKLFDVTIGEMRVSRVGENRLPYACPIDGSTPACVLETDDGKLVTAREILDDVRSKYTPGSD